MASIFTFDPDPPRVSSPWATPPVGDSATPPTSQQASKSLLSKLREYGGLESNSEPQASGIHYTNITRLEAEPQEGPTEYKLHLLLRRRRSFTRTSTGHHITGSMRRSDNPIPLPVSRGVSETNLLPNTPPPLASTQSKQHRLEQLTTQLLWRLQQSCPYHISSSTAPVLPHFPDDARLSAPEMPRRLLPGLEESKGALYEIGVADDGTFVGLAEDEMEESLNNLRAMAASLGCGVEVMRRVSVGQCEWLEAPGTPLEKMQRSELLVAEALVRPDQHLIDHTKAQGGRDVQLDLTSSGESLAALADDSQVVTEQLRVSVTGATMSGKSSLLGTLSTATLDNGRGKSRLSLLKHRHEIASGMTSSVTQELIGYRDMKDDETTAATQVISYGSGDVTSWIDIHAAVEAADNGRLVFLSDSAGHPRFRRTTVRGIVGWQPHWTILCVPADNTDASSGRIGASPTSEELLGPAAADLDLSHAHLQLCLALELPLVIVITKYDLATKAGLRQTLSKLFSAVKEAKRKPYLISDPATSTLEAGLSTVAASDLNDADKTIQHLSDSPLAAVPVILTSSVKGTGIHKLHAFLRKLPIPPQTMSPAPPTPPSPLFYIEDVYSTHTNPPTNRTAIIGGYLRYGTLSIGDQLLLGPYPVDISSDDSDSSSTQPHRTRNSTLPTSRSFPGALTSKSSLMKHDQQHAEWRRVRISSLRNLRLPVCVLRAGQVGTMGVVPVVGDGDGDETSGINRIRKGMVLSPCSVKQPASYKIISVRFEGEQANGVGGLGVGMAVVVYVASVRASSKILSVGVEMSPLSSSHTDLSKGNSDEDNDAFGFGFEDEACTVEGKEGISVLVSFQFIASREFVEHGARALVMPGGGMGLLGNERGAKGMAGLEGFVGKVVVMDGGGDM